MPYAYVDAHATFGLSHDAGLEKTIHSDTAESSIQDSLNGQEFELQKIGREHDPAAI